jgi:hypothetical protein
VCWRISGPETSPKAREQVLPGRARTTSIVRVAIQRSQKSLQTLAKGQIIKQKTVAKWRKRSITTDAPMEPTPASPMLTVEQEAIIVAFKTHTSLSLDNCWHALQATLSHLSRSALPRCFKR